MNHRVLAPRAPASSLALASALAAAAALGGCSELLPAATRPSVALTVQQSSLHVGAARVQITPPPGVALYGHGPTGRVAAGLWTRLYCRAFVFEPHPSKQRFALVSCDLAAISTLLHRKVGARATARGLGLSAPRILLSATHTHAGPGHYFGCRNYNGPASSRRHGYDPKMVEFLAERISAALAKASARLALASLRWRHRQHWRLTRNRSLASYRLNRPPAHTAPAARWRRRHRRLVPGERAIDPRLDTLWIRRGESGALVGTVTFLAMHPTVIGAASPLLGADVFGVTSRALSRRAGDDGESVHALVNTNEGDIAAHWSAGSIDEAVSNGRKLARLIWRGAPPPRGALDVRVGLRYAEVLLPYAAADHQRSLCRKALLGVAALYGASDHPTPLAPVGAAHRQRLAAAVSKRCHAPKRILGGWLQPAFFSTRYSYPRWAALATLALGDTLIAFVPAELTYTAGRRIADAVAAKARYHQLGTPHVIVGGLTNGYLQYVATAEEYGAQAYEGASTLYGRHSLALLLRELVHLTTWLGQPVSQDIADRIDVTRARRYDGGRSRSRLPLPRLSDSAKPAALRTCRLTPRAARQQQVCFVFRHGRPAYLWWKPAPGGGGSAPLEPRARLLDAVVDQSGVSLASDRGVAFVTRVHERRARGTIYSTVYRYRRMASSSRVRLRVSGPGAPLISDELDRGAPEKLARCDTRVALVCAGKMRYAEAVAQ